MRVNPAEGLIVKDPATRQPIRDGHEILNNETYWHRRIISGDVTVVAEKNKAAAAVKQETKKNNKSTDGGI